MLGTPKPLAPIREGEGVCQESPQRWHRGTGRSGGTGKRNYGRLARSNEHSPSIAISGRKSGHFVQVRWRTENSRVQVRQSLALQEIEAGPVDGREVQRNGTGRKTQAESCGESGRASLEKRRGRKCPRHTK